ncbi:MAG TPA: aspartyl protease family protein [Sedimentisphaerales bacterium]|nr:aspartyl protease family protein [Sedimentisphaerales bacterium]
MSQNRVFKGKIIIFCLVLFVSVVQADRQWVRKEVNWMGPETSKIKAVYYPEYDKELIEGDFISVASQVLVKAQGSIAAMVIDSPPIDGFIPWIAINITDERISELDGIYDATVEPQISGDYLTNNPASNYAIGLFDTGASACVMSADAADITGISANPDMITSNPIELSGVNDSVLAYVSQPMGLFVGGLRNIDSDEHLSDVNMVGLSNVALVIADHIDSPNVPTVAGSPMSVNYNTIFDNSNPITVEVDGQQYTAPDIQILDSSSSIPDYRNSIPLELRPLGATSVQYAPTINYETYEFEPSSPSIIVGTSSQNLFFVSSVDMYQGSYQAYDKNRFMLDTGAQVTVIGSRIAARLGLDPQNAEFQVEIEGATGQIEMVDGFYIDKIEIPALGQWLSFTNVPVILLDVSSPEGGTLDGIIGMNLFTQLDFVLKGGGMFLQDDPSLIFQIIQSAKADFNKDGSIDFYDFSLLASVRQRQSEQPDWDSLFDISNPSDSVIDLGDLVIFAENWLAN